MLGLRRHAAGPDPSTRAAAPPPGAGLSLYAAEVARDDTWRDLHDLPAAPDIVDEDRPLRARLRTHARLATLQPTSAVYRVRKADGSTRVVWEHVFPRARLTSGAIRVEGLVFDVSDRFQALQRAREAERRLEQVLASVEETVYAAEIGPESVRLTFVGPGSERLFGGTLAPGEDVLAAWAERIHLDDRETAERFCATLRRGEPASAVVRLHGIDGRVRWIWSRARPRPVEAAADGSTVTVDGVASDVSERQRVAEELREACDAAERRGQYDAATGTLGTRRIREVMRDELQRAAVVGGGFAVAILEIDHLERIAEGSGDLARDAVLRAIAGRLRTHLGHGALIGRAAEPASFALALPYVASESQLRVLGHELGAVVADSPVAARGARYGLTLSIGGAVATPGTWSLEALLDAAGRALQAARDAGRDRVVIAGDPEASIPLAAALAGAADPVDERDAIRIAVAIGRSAEVRQGVADAHLARVGDLAGRVATALALPAGTVHLCRLVGYLHDVGKVAIPDAILAKAGPLDEREWDVMRTHPVIGAGIVSGTVGVAEAALGVRHHHERFDGAGYPDRLRGDAIPLEARVVAAVDAFTAMTEQRLYRAARSRADAVAELRASAGSHLDPAVVEALCSVLHAEAAEPVPATPRPRSTT
jgi:diguanylate cyclase (GGDEF)-like protein